MLDGGLVQPNSSPTAKGSQFQNGKSLLLSNPTPPPWISEISDLEEKSKLIYGAQ